MINSYVSFEQFPEIANLTAPLSFLKIQFVKVEESDL